MCDSNGKIRLTEKEREELEELEKNLRNKSVIKRLQTIKLRAKGIRDRDISIKLNCSLKSVARWIKKYKEGGLGKLLVGDNNGKKININRMTSEPESLLEDNSGFLNQFYSFVM